MNCFEILNSRLRVGWPTRDVGGRISGSAALKIRLRQFPGLSTRSEDDHRGRSPEALLHRLFPQEMINPGQVLADLPTADAGG